MPTLDFKGKQHIYAHHLTVPYRPLEPDESRSCNPSSADDNLIIHGDNLHALKALLPRYANRVKCIYIDPPYNTGSQAWVYNDRVNSPLMQAWFAQHSPVDGEDLERHDKWLCMMWPRLHLLKELLADDGVIFISIDDNEQHHLRLLMNEIFGTENFIGGFVWRKKAGAGADSKLFFRQHEHILMYSKNVGLITELFQPLTEKQRGEYKNPDSDPRGVWASTDLTRTGDNDPRRIYEVISPTGKRFTRCWTYTKPNFQQLIEDNLIWWGKDGNSVPKRKRFLKEKKGLTPRSWIDIALTSDGKRDLEEIDHAIFDYPKPVKLVKLFLQIATKPGDVILDSFAGSGTTAQAVLTLNGEDSGNRKFILIECEDYADTITAERVRRIINGVPDAREDSLREGLGGSFTYCTLGKPMDVEEMLTGEALPSYESLAAYLLYTTSGVACGAEGVERKNGDGLFHSDEDVDYYLLYEPDLEYLLSDEAMLNLDRAKRIRDASCGNGKKAIVYGAGKYISQRDLTKMKITFCQLPHALQER